MILNSVKRVLVNLLLRSYRSNVSRAITGIQERFLAGICSRGCLDHLIPALGFQSRTKPYTTNSSLLGYLIEAEQVARSDLHGILISGWLFHQSRSVRLLSLAVDDEESVLADYCLDSPSAEVSFSCFPQSSRCGFQCFIAGEFEEGASVTPNFEATLSSGKKVRGEFEKITVQRSAEYREIINLQL